MNTEHYAFLHFFHMDKANAAIHLADVKFSPITFALARSIGHYGAWFDELEEVLEADGKYELDHGR